MKMSTKERKDYINWLYSKEEQKQIRDSIKRKRMANETAMQDYLLLDEEMRILKKHFKLTPKKFAEIIDKYRIPSKGEEELINLLNR